MIRVSTMSSGTSARTVTGVPPRPTSAVDSEDLAGDRRRLVGHEEDRCVGDGTRVEDPVGERLLGPCECKDLVVGLRSGRHRGGDQRRSDGVDADPSDAWAAAVVVTSASCAPFAAA